MHLKKMRDYLREAVNKRLSETYDISRATNEGYFNFSDPIDSDARGVCRQTLNDMQGNFGEQLDLSDLPNQRFGAPAELVQFVKNLRSHLEKAREDLLAIVHQYKERESSLYGSEAPPPVWSTVSLVSYFISAMDHALALEAGEIDPPASAAPALDSQLRTLLLTLEGFGRFARQIKQRRNSEDKPRETLHVKDEYDVQDALHAIFAIYFGDIRAEEFTPSYAGSNSRMDFFLKPEQTVIEVKYARKGHISKEIGRELAIDFAQYKQRADVKTLVCFVFDPERLIANVAGLKGDVEGLSTEQLKVIVVVGS